MAATGIFLEVMGPQLAVVDVGPLVALAGLLLDAGDLLPFLLGRLDLVLDDGDDVLVDVEVVVEVLRHVIVDEAADGGAVVPVLLPEVEGTELDLGLALELGLLDLYADGSDDALAAVLGGIILLEELLEGLRYGLPVCGEVGPAVPGVLTVDEGCDVLAVGIPVGEHYLDVFAFEMDGRVERLLAKVLIDQVEEAVLGFVCDPVEVE